MNTPINQCDGCNRNLPLIDGIHKGEGYDMMSCTKEKYTPIEKKEERNGCNCGCNGNNRYCDTHHCSDECAKYNGTDIDTGWEEKLRQKFPDMEREINGWFKHKCNYEQMPRPTVAKTFGIPPLEDYIKDLLTSHERTAYEKGYTDGLKGGNNDL